MWKYHCLSPSYNSLLEIHSHSSCTELRVSALEAILLALWQCITFVLWCITLPVSLNCLHHCRMLCDVGAVVLKSLLNSRCTHWTLLLTFLYKITYSVLLDYHCCGCVCVCVCFAPNHTKLNPVFINLLHFSQPCLSCGLSTINLPSWMNNMGWNIFLSLYCLHQFSCVLHSASAL
jgi:hypothetical protein